jgi:hypothetical protein
LNGVLIKRERDVPEEEGLAGLEVVDEATMEVDDDDMLVQMEARLAQLASRVSSWSTIDAGRR